MSVEEHRNVGEDRFSACWDRLERADQHRLALARIWNDFIDDHPFHFSLVHQGGGVHLLQVWQDRPIPSGFALELGEWLYNARASLDYIIWVTCAYTTGQVPPKNQGTLQYPIYDTLKAWTDNEYRLKHLAPHHREMLWIMQPFNSNTDANYLGVINRLARIDRHRRLTIGTSYLAELEPVMQVPAGCDVALQWGQRVLVDGHADVARITVTPWGDDTEVRINPRIGIDPEVEEWAESPFWSRVRFSERLAMIQLFLKAEVASYEYDCTGSSRMPEAITDSFRAECDARGRPGPIRSTPRAAVEWSAVAPAKESSLERFEGGAFPPGSATPNLRDA